MEPDQVDASRGIYPKYVVFRHPDFEPDYVSAEAVPGYVQLEQVEDFTFTLRPSKDYHARVALAAYAESVRHWNPALAQDIEEALSLITYPPRFEPT